MILETSSPPSRSQIRKPSSKLSAYLARSLPLYIMMIPGLILLILFSYLNVRFFDRDYGGIGSTCTARA